MADHRGTVALTNIITASQELHTLIEAYEEGIALLQQIAAGRASATEASHFLMELERRNLVRVGYYDSIARLRDILTRTEAPGRISQVTWELFSNYRDILMSIVEQNPDNTKNALKKPGLRRWFLGQMLKRSVSANTHVADIMTLIETVFKEASR